MDINWIEVKNIKSFVLSVLKEEADDIPIDKIQGSEWILSDININAINVNNSLLRKHDKEKLHLKRRDKFVELIKSEKEIYPLIVLGKDLYLVDGYARYRALKKMGIKKIKVFMQTTRAENFLGKEIEVIIDRPLGSKHPKHGFKYETNYGYIPQISRWRRTRCLLFRSE